VFGIPVAGSATIFIASSEADSHPHRFRQQAKALRHF
jgi:hypothetical protein